VHQVSRKLGTRRKLQGDNIQPYLAIAKLSSPGSMQGKVMMERQPSIIVAYYRRPGGRRFLVVSENETFIATGITYYCLKVISSENEGLSIKYLSKLNRLLQVFSPSTVACTKQSKFEFSHVKYLRWCMKKPSVLITNQQN
jgi:hypothetical protein